MNLPPKVFAALCLLAEHRGGVVSKTALMEALWPESYVGESSLTQNIFLLRKALGRMEDGREYIETLPKRGYRIAVPVDSFQESVTTGLIVNEAEKAPTSERIAENKTGLLVKEAEFVVLERPLEPVERPALLLDQAESQVSRQRWIFAAVAILFVGIVAGSVLAARRLLMWQQPTVLRSERITNDGAYKEHFIPLLIDRTHIYFSEDVDTTSYLAEVASEGGETTRHASPTASSTAFSYSKARNELLFGSLWERTPEHPLLAQSVPDGAVHSVGGISAHSANWSPDGKRITFAKGLSIYVADSNGGNVQELAHLRETPYWPRFSPDGSHIRFSVQARSEKASLWEVESSGQGLRPLFSTEAWSKQACCGDWTPDGRYFVFAVDDGRRSTLWTARDSGSGWFRSSPVEIANGPADFWRSPIVGADGKHIFALGEHARGHLIKFNPQSQKFEPYLNGLSTDTISFSRDGKWMAYTAYPEGTLWRSRVDGSERLRLTDPPRVARFPQWSPDGTQIVYITAESIGQWKIHKVSVNGGESQQLVFDNSSQGAATWSPDGTRIAFGQIVGFGVDRHAEKIRIFDFKSGRLTDVPNSSGLWTARWSPDGQYLSAVTADNRKLMLYDFQTGNWQQLADVGTNDVVWGGDSQDIFFDSTDEPAIYQFRVKDRKLKKIIDLRGMRRTGFYGWSLNLALDNNPVLLEEAGINEVYSLYTYFP